MAEKKPEPPKPASVLPPPRAHGPLAPRVWASSLNTPRHLGKPPHSLQKHGFSIITADAHVSKGKLCLG